MQNIERKPLGIIDALSNGYALVVRRPWVLLFPIVFNLFLWLGPQINARPIFDQADWLSAPRYADHVPAYRTVVWYLDLGRESPRCRRRERMRQRVAVAVR